MPDYARTRIDAGKDKDGKDRIFEVGQPVTGLPEDEIKKLRDAGALTDQPPARDDAGEHVPASSWESAEAAKGKQQQPPQPPAKK